MQVRAAYITSPICVSLRWSPPLFCRVQACGQAVCGLVVRREQLAAETSLAAVRPAAAQTHSITEEPMLAPERV